MSRHSKNNTSLAFFTSAERERLTYGTQKECIFENILSQKREIARLQKLSETQRQLIDDEIRRREEALKDAEIERFERTQTRILGDDGGKNVRDALVVGASSAIGGNRVGGKVVGSNGAGAGGVGNGEFGVGNGELREIEGKMFKAIKTDEGTLYLPDITADTDEEKVKLYQAMKDLESRANNKSALPSFWVTSLTPDAKPIIIEAPQKDLLCTAADPPHTIPSFKKLVKVVFTKPKRKEGEQADGSSVCPSCIKNFNNGSKIVVLKGCGHVICKECYQRFVRGVNKCNVCDEKCKLIDVIELHSEGTGFAGSGGKVQVQKAGIGFQ
ncbi:hypothetical protein HDU76_013697 [Blyttiomyces sp. JEL0837]|nr:hypothetical protein HDU76_013697 [Blyttiomyces sp. JEL0837]